MNNITSEISHIKYEKENINSILKSYNNSNNNPKNIVEFYGVIDGYKHQTMYLKGNDYNIKCNITKKSYEKNKREIYNKCCEREEETLILLKGIPYFCGFTFQFCVKQVEIIEIC